MPFRRQASIWVNDGQLIVLHICRQTRGTFFQIQDTIASHVLCSWLYMTAQRSLLNICRQVSTSVTTNNYILNAWGVSLRIHWPSSQMRVRGIVDSQCIIKKDVRCDMSWKLDGISPLPARGHHVSFNTKYTMYLKIRCNENEFGVGYELPSCHNHRYCRFVYLAVRVECNNQSLMGIRIRHLEY